MPEKLLREMDNLAPLWALNAEELRRCDILCNENPKQVH
jgi:hypothetical protein